MSLPEVVSRDEWLAARKALLVKEKQITRRRDSLNADRRRLPMVRIEQDYVFEGPAGTTRLVDMFEGSRQLVVQHFMFDPTWDRGCSFCSASARWISPGLLRNLRARETNFAAVSRATLSQIEAYKSANGWTFPWYSSYGSDFNYDFHATLDETVAPLEYNYKNKAELEAVGSVMLPDESGEPVEAPGLSFFLRDGEAVFHTYSTYSRGTEMIGGAYFFLDLTALGRQEDWEEPKERVHHPYRPEPNFAT